MKKGLIFVFDCIKFNNRILRDYTRTVYNILFYTKDIVQIFIKNNIQVLSDTLHDLFNIYSMFINNEQFVLVSIFPFGTSQNILPKKDKNQIITFNNNLITI
ncbi:hypothetical protein PNOK_m000112 (mitochondrion) [Pyrrhoderma noxium]|uniref:Uncharacterized protein n=1 Tax=Pyrrhoderma noxium TaxID=2282107 RepID=A0A541AXQ4_9AGAM|nr:hypothetical protein PNOK_m000112 [Pyrrhoderma noxium]